MQTTDDKFATRNKSKPKEMMMMGTNEIPPPHLLHRHHTQQYVQQQLSLNNEASPHHHHLDQDQRRTPAQFSVDKNNAYGHFTSEHEIKFTKSEVCTPAGCICFFIACMFSFVAIMSGVYYGLNFFDGKNIKEKVFKAQFVVRNQDLLSLNLENVESNEFQTLSHSFKHTLDQLFQESVIARSYVKNEIIAFERRPAKQNGVVVHFNVHVATNKQTVDSPQIYLILADEIANNKLRLLEKWSIELNSLDVQERKWAPRETSSSTLLLNPWSHKSMFPGMLEGLSTEPSPTPRRCMNMGLSYCQFVRYNRTSYPNLLNHWNLSSIEEEFIMYKEIIDSECYYLAREFLCILLQPECVDDDIILPCRSFCTEFYNSCQRWLSEKLTNKITCSNFPEQQNLSTVSNKRNKKSKTCRGKPNCAARLRLQAQQHKLCDGVVDCDDGSDENDCSYCPGGNANHFHCGNKQCVPKSAQCDAVKHCRNGADERNCLILMPDAHTRERELNVNRGFLMAINKGSYVCAVESSVDEMRNLSHIFYNNQLQILGLNICNENNFEELIQIKSKHIDLNGPFSKFVPGTTLISSQSTQCRNREVYYLECAMPKCGISLLQSEDAFSSSTQEYRHSFPGDWPWYAKILLNGNYICDGTLISHDTVLVNAACFGTNRNRLNDNNYNNQSVTVTLGSVRIHQDNSQAEQFFVERVNLITLFHNSQQQLQLLKLNQTVSSSHTIRPICHSKDIVTSVSNFTVLHCVLLGINYELDRLQHKRVHVTNLDQCNTDSLNQTSFSSSSPSSSSSSSSSLGSSFSRQSNQICVHLGSINNVGSNNNNNNNSQYGFGNTESISQGRHLYCLFKNSWYFFAIESNVSAKQGFTWFHLLPSL